MEFPWYGWIVITAIIVWGFVVIFGGPTWKRGSRNAGLQQALEDNAASNRALLAKLDTIDTRLGVVEKTLTDIQ
jgi:hypothetical protein